MKKKLKLTKQILRNLNPATLAKAAGGGDVQGSLDCTITYPGCHAVISVPPACAI